MSVELQQFLEVALVGLDAPFAVLVLGELHVDYVFVESPQEGLIVADGLGVVVLVEILLLVAHKPAQVVHGPAGQLDLTEHVLEHRYVSPGCHHQLPPLLRDPVPQLQLVHGQRVALHLTHELLLGPHQETVDCQVYYLPVLSALLADPETNKVEERVAQHVLTELPVSLEAHLDCVPQAHLELLDLLPLLVEPLISLPSDFMPELYMPLRPVEFFWVHDLDRPEYAFEVVEGFLPDGRAGLVDDDEAGGFVEGVLAGAPEVDATAHEALSGDHHEGQVEEQFVAELDGELRGQLACSALLTEHQQEHVLLAEAVLQDDCLQALRQDRGIVLLPGEGGVALSQQLVGQDHPHHQYFLLYDLQQHLQALLGQFVIDDERKGPTLLKRVDGLPQVVLLAVNDGAGDEVGLVDPPVGGDSVHCLPPLNLHLIAQPRPGVVGQTINQDQRQESLWEVSSVSPCWLDIFRSAWISFRIRVCFRI